MNRILVPTIHEGKGTFWTVELYDGEFYNEYAVYSPDLDSAIYEVLTYTNKTKTAIVSIKKY